MRSSMANLVNTLRTMIGDTIGTVCAFEDDTLQQYLDKHREQVRTQPLRYESTPQPGTGVAQFFDYYADAPWWEDDWIIINQTFTPITPATKDAITGHITFSLSTIPPLYVTGKFYDLNAAAADALIASATLIGSDVDTKEGDAQYAYSQRRSGRLEMAKMYRSLAWAGSVKLTRCD